MAPVVVVAEEVALVAAEATMLVVEAAEDTAAVDMVSRIPSQAERSLTPCHRRWRWI